MRQYELTTHLLFHPKQLSWFEFASRQGPGAERALTRCELELRMLLRMKKQLPQALFFNTAEGTFSLGS